MFNQAYKNKKIIITGHTGFKGSWLSIWLNKLNAKEILGISLDENKKYLNYHFSQNKKLMINNFINIKDLKKIKKIIVDFKPDYIFHLAAQPLVKDAFIDPVETYETNVIGTANILESLRFLDNKCLGIFITSDKCYKNLEKKIEYKEDDVLAGKDPYSASKSSAEILINSYFETYFNLKNSNIRITSVRAGNVVGGGDWSPNRIVPDCIKSWSNNDSVIINNPNSTRPWLFVLEPLSGYLHLGSQLNINKKLNGESFNFGPKLNKNVKVKALVNELSKNWPHSSYKIAKNKNTYDSKLLQLNCQKAKKILNWESILNIYQLSNFTVKWYLNYFNKKGNKKISFDQIENFENLAKTNNQIWTK